jgi:serine/threonine-protein kinase
MRVGRFVLYEPFAEGGGGASLHLGCTSGDGELRRIVAIKQLHRSAAGGRDVDEPLAELLDEARTAARVHHRNVVQVLELCEGEGGVFLVMEYVHGATLAELRAGARRRGEALPAALACTVIGDVLLGLHAAHAATSPDGRSAGIVHRDVSPDNILVGADGVARIGDFGIAKSAGRMQRTAVGQVKGRLAYLAPERLLDDEATPLCDVYAAGVVLYELLAGRPPFVLRDDDRDALIGEVLGGIVQPPSAWADVPPALDAVVLRATALRPEERFADARAFAAELEAVAERWSPRRVGAWVEAMAAEPLALRARRIAELLAEEKTVVRVPPRAATAAKASVPARPRFVRRALGALGVAAALGGAVLAAMALRAPEAPDNPDGTDPTAASEAESGGAPGSAAEPSAAAPPGVADGPLPPPVESASNETEVAPRSPAPSPRAARPERGCVPPYRIDAQGIRRWKKGCTE